MKRLKPSFLHFQLTSTFQQPDIAILKQQRDSLKKSIWQNSNQMFREIIKQNREKKTEKIMG